ncbi:B-cell receptor CD22-like [Alosa alosa]|nr:B-cell receptor CD22-like [Alosa alosa]
MSVSVGPSGEIVEGDSVTLICNSDANPPVHNYTWYRRSGDKTAQVATGLKYSITNTSTAHRGHYYCEARNDIGVKSTDVTLLNIRYSPKSISVSASLSGDLSEGTTVTLTCSSDANPPVHNHTWYMKSGAEALIRGTGESISFNVTSDTSGLYYCEAKNEIGSQNSTEVQILLAGNQDSSMVLAAEVILIVILIPILILLGLLWLRIRKKRHPSGSGTRTQQEDTESDANAVNATISAVAMTAGPSQAACAAYEDVHYASIQFSGSKGREGPVYGNIRQPKPPKQREDVEYSTVKFSQPSAATQSEDKSAIYSTVNKSSRT